MVVRGVKRPLSRTGGCCSTMPAPTNSELDTNGAIIRNSSCCRCRGRAASSLRLVSVFGLHMLGFVTCPCLGFAGSGTFGGFLLERRKPGEMSRRIGDAKYARVGYQHQTSALGFRGREGKGRVRYRKCNSNLDNFLFLGASWRGTRDTHRATVLHSAEEGCSLGIAYDRGLLNGGVKIKETAPQDSRSNDDTVSQTPALVATQSEEIRGQDSSFLDSSSTASESVAENLTTRFSYAVNRAISKASIEKGQQQQYIKEERRAPPRPEEVRAPPGRKWTGTKWTGDSWRAGEGSAERRRQTSVIGASRASDSKKTVATCPTVSPEAKQGSRLDADVMLVVDTAREYRTVRDVNTTSLEATQRRYNTPERRSWRVWSRPKEIVVVDAIEQGDVGKTAREELTIYLLATGATQQDVTKAAGALLAVDSNLALTTGTWKRWRKNLDGLRHTGFMGADVAKVLEIYPQLLALDFEAQVKPTIEVFRERLGMRPTDVRRMVRKAPEVLAPRTDGSTATDTVNVLKALGMQTRYLKQEALKWPQLLALPPANFFQLAAFLASEEVGIKASNIGSLLRQAPWLVVERIDGQMLPVVRFLRRVGVFDMERVVRAYPKILCLNVRSDLVPRVRFLWAEVGISEEDLPRVLQTFPLVFAVPLWRMRDVADFLAVDLSINTRDVAKIIRAFPSLLGLERERHIDGVVHYLKKLGVQNVGRFVSRLPPVLGYDVDTNLVPKMDFLIEVMGLSVYDVLTFPAYFSYPLDTVIEPRTEFLKIRGRPITLVGLNIALQGGDADFASRVARVRPDVYSQFKEAYKANREGVRSGKASPESLLTIGQRRAIQSLRGQTTSSNISGMQNIQVIPTDDTSRARGVRPADDTPQ